MLSRQSTDAMLNILEEDPPRRATFIFSTEHIERLPANLVDRCDKHPVSAFSQADLVSHARKICVGENIATDELGLLVLADLADGHMRAMIENLEEVHTRYGNANEESVRKCFNLKLEDDLEMLCALLRGSLKSSIEASGRMTRSPDDTQKLLVRILTGLRLEAMSIDCPDTIYLGVPTNTRRECLILAQKLACELNITTRNFWKEFTDLWNTNPLVSRADLSRKLIDSHEWLFEREDQNPSVLRRPETREAESTQNRRPHIRPAQRVSRAYLTLSAAVQLWDAASFMAQEFGVYLNTRIVLRHDRLGISSEEAASRFNSNLVRKLSGRLAYWTGGNPHWLYVHSRWENCLSSTIVMHLPADVVEFAEEWLFEHFLRKQFETSPINAVSLRSVNHMDERSAALHHRRLLRFLCSNVDPGIFIRGLSRQRLIDVLEIPNALRKQYLPVNLPQLHRVSKTIGTSAIEKCRDIKFHPLTPAKDGAWSYNNPGWEMGEHRDRRVLAGELLAQRQSFEPSNGDGHRTLQLKSIQRNRLQQSQPYDAKDRSRSWPTLTQPAWWPDRPKRTVRQE